MIENQSKNYILFKYKFTRPFNDWMFFIMSYYTNIDWTEKKEEIIAVLAPSYAIVKQRNVAFKSIRFEII